MTAKKDPEISSMIPRAGASKYANATRQVRQDPSAPAFEYPEVVTAIAKLEKVVRVLPPLWVTKGNYTTEVLCGTLPEAL